MVVSGVPGRLAPTDGVESCRRHSERRGRAAATAGSRLPLPLIRAYGTRRNGGRLRHSERRRAARPSSRGPRGARSGEVARSWSWPPAHAVASDVAGRIAPTDGVESCRRHSERREKAAATAGSRLPLPLIRAYSTRRSGERLQHSERRSRPRGPLPPCRCPTSCRHDRRCRAFGTRTRQSRPWGDPSPVSSGHSCGRSGVGRARRAWRGTCGGRDGQAAPVGAMRLRRGRPRRALRQAQGERDARSRGLTANSAEHSRTTIRFTC